MPGSATYVLREAQKEIERLRQEIERLRSENSALRGGMQMGKEPPATLFGNEGDGEG